MVLNKKIMNIALFAILASAGVSFYASDDKGLKVSQNGHFINDFSDNVEVGTKVEAYVSSTSEDGGNWEVKWRVAEQAIVPEPAIPAEKSKCPCEEKIEKVVEGLEKSAVSLGSSAGLFATKVVPKSIVDFVIDIAKARIAKTDLVQNWIGEGATFDVRSELDENDGRLVRWRKNAQNFVAPLVDRAAPHVVGAIKIVADSGLRAFATTPVDLGIDLTFNKAKLGDSKKSARQLSKESAHLLLSIFKRNFKVEFYCNFAREYVVSGVAARLEGREFMGSKKLHAFLAWLADSDSKMSNVVWRCVKQAAAEVRA